MALDPIIDLVKCRLPFATDIDAKITSFTTEAFYLLHNVFGVFDPDIENETAYSPLQRTLIADYVAYILLMRKAIQTAGGTTSGEQGNGGKLLKRAKADVVESEFIYSTAADGSSVMIKTDELISELKQSICDKGRALNVNLPFTFCDCLPVDIVPPFKIYC